uniref:Uncharacterized protein n=1 Tax=Anopheles christyi TaxID=43041 RepID=A0A182KIN9_9DIPT
MCRRKMRWPASCPNSSRKSIHSRWLDSFFDELLQIDRWSVIWVRIRRVTYSVLEFSRSFRCLAASVYDGTFDRCFALSIICASTMNARSMLMLSWADVSTSSIWPLYSLREQIFSASRTYSSFASSFLVVTSTTGFFTFRMLLMICVTNSTCFSTVRFGTTLTSNTHTNPSTRKRPSGRTISSYSCSIPSWFLQMYFSFSCDGIRIEAHRLMYGSILPTLNG